MEALVLNASAQYHLLFPEELMTSGKIAAWCGDIFSKSFVQKILRKHLLFDQVGNRYYYRFQNEQVALDWLSEKYR